MTTYYGFPLTPPAAAPPKKKGPLVMTDERKRRYTHQTIEWDETKRCLTMTTDGGRPSTNWRDYFKFPIGVTMRVREPRINRYGATWIVIWMFAERR